MQGQIDVLRETMNDSLDDYKELMNTTFRENRIQLNQLSSKMRITDAAAHLDRAISAKKDAMHAVDRWEDRLYETAYSHQTSTTDYLIYLNYSLLTTDPIQVAHIERKMQQAQQELDAAKLVEQAKQVALNDIELENARMIEHNMNGSITAPTTPRKRIRPTESAPTLQPLPPSPAQPSAQTSSSVAIDTTNGMQTD
ncbi:hypothetical protein P7C70_g3734, partial [Phenoliferia sp. Uapishka_3]